MNIIINDLMVKKDHVVSINAISGIIYLKGGFTMHVTTQTARELIEKMSPRTRDELLEQATAGMCRPPLDLTAVPVQWVRPKEHYDGEARLAREEYLKNLESCTIIGSPFV